jgi:hypothetical protein
MKSLSLVVSLTAVLTVPAFGNVGPSIEVPVAPPVIARAAGTQQAPQVATDGHDFFAVWLDSRGLNTSVFGTRILADGTVLDPTGILIASPGVECSSPGLVWDGSNYVVVWMEEHDIPYFSTRASFARVDHNGTVLGGSKTLLDHVSGVPLIASNGHGSVVIFESFVGSIANISQDGSVTQKQSLSGLGGDRQIASNGDGYLLSWTGPTTSLLRLDDNGDLVAGSAQQLNEAIYTKSAAGIGGPYLLVGRNFGPDYSSCASSIFGRLVTNTGLSDPFVIYDAGHGDIQDLAVTPDGNGFQVVWMKRLGDFPCGPVLDSDPPSFLGPWPPFGLAQIHVGPDGSSGTPVTQDEGSGTDEQPAVAGNGAAQVLAWISDTSSPQIAAAMARPGEPALSIPIASSAAMEVYSSVAAADSMFMTAWVEGDPFDGLSALYARRFGTDGRAIDAAAIKVSADDQARNFSPVVSFDGAVWLFLWFAGPGASARRMAADGTWIDAVPFPIGPTDRVFDYAVASNGNGFAVVVLAAGPALSLTLIPRTGEARQVPVAVPGLKSDLGYPSMAWDGNAYVAVWRQGTDDDIEGIRLDQDGQVITPLFGIDRTSRLDDTPSIACREGACAVAWQSDDSIAAASIIGGTVIPFKTMIAPSSPTTYLTAPQLIATQSGYQLFWNEEGDPKPSLLTASITQSGIDSPTLLGTAGVTGAAITPRGQIALSLVHAANDPVDGGVARAFLRVWLPSEVRRRAVGR